MLTLLSGFLGGGDLLFELLVDLGSNRVIVHDAVELLAGGPDYTGLNILVH